MTAVKRCASEPINFCNNRDAHTIPNVAAPKMGDSLGVALPAPRPTPRLRIMTTKTFRDLLANRPFKPFRLVMSSGKTYEVRPPEMAMLTKTDMLVGIEIDDGVPAAFEICSHLHVTAIEPILTNSTQTSSPESN
jgi:hypothetical protein